ncbi:hypothetical protein PoB_004023200 [Plakobranchus ocellatus]|uniref:Uncharacterized protein n=1 Tax=Plakobranchus ocellatus TaxID=259542 RepID=A0AAV4B3K9_9GAST|nr:hypothetical protein PoB_004023200 [Plakobranchus ocellatus]
MSHIPHVLGQSQGYAVMMELTLPYHYQNKGKNVTMDNERCNEGLFAGHGATCGGKICNCCYYHCYRSQEERTLRFVPLEGQQEGHSEVP